MPSESRKRTRSVSGELASDGDYEEDNHSMAEDNVSQLGRPGRKRKPNSSQAARRDQNRIAQREFRLRKQQRIRDLEARVELLTANKDETYIQMRDIIRELISENYTLRSLVRNLSNFIGEGAGGVLPALGWTMEEFQAFIKKADTDTAFEAYMKHRKSNGAAAKSQLVNNVESDQRQVPNQNCIQRQQQQHQQQQGSPSNPTQVTIPGPRQHDDTPDNSLNYSAIANAYASSSANSPQLLSLLSGIRPSYNSGFLNGLHDTSQTISYTSTPLEFSASPVPPPLPPPPPPPSLTNGGQRIISSFVPPPITSSEHHSFTSDDTDSIANHAFGAPAVQDACKLISYHLDNFRRNSVYCLPASLRPTPVQRTVDHDRLIDGIPHPEIRNRMILLKDRFDLLDCIDKYLKYTDIHGDDVLDHTNWEIHDIWLKEFGFLVDSTTLAVVNRWRKERDEREITMAEICPSEHISGIVMA